MATTCEHVAPGDLITAEFVNCLLDKITALEARVKQLEGSQLTPDWKDYFNDLLKDYLKENDSRLLKLLEGWLKENDPRLTKRLEGLLKEDDPRLYKILEGWLKPGDIRIVEQIKNWLKPDDPWLEELLGNWIKIDGPRLQGVLNEYVRAKGLVDASVLGKYAELGEITSKLDDYYTKDEAQNHFASMTEMANVATKATNQMAALGMALFSGTDIRTISAKLNTAGKAVLNEVLDKAGSFRG